MTVKKRFFGGNWTSYLYGAAIFLEHSSNLSLNAGFVEVDGKVTLRVTVKRFGPPNNEGIRKAEVLGVLEVSL